MPLNAFFLLFISVVISCFERSYSAGLQHTDSEKVPIHMLNANGYIRDWLILGPLPNQPHSESIPERELQSSFDTDYLSTLGGETRAKITKRTVLIYRDTHSQQHTHRPLSAKAGKNGIIDFEKYFGAVDYKVAYAYCHIYSEIDQDAVFLLGSDDGAKVWINGIPVHSIDIGRSLVYRNDKFSTKLKKGFNPILVKISELVNTWGFVLEAFDEAGYANIEAHEKEMADFDAFLNCTLVPKEANRWNYVFGPGEFPELEWEKPYLVEHVVGKFPLKIRWFDDQLREASQANKPGRYAFVAEGITPDGMHIHRARTLYCMPWEWMAWAERPKAYLMYLPLAIFNENAWAANREVIADFSGRIVLLSMLDQKEGAILLSYLDEMKSIKNNTRLKETPIIRDHEYHLALKRKIVGMGNKWPALKMPQKISGAPAPAIREGTEREAGVKAGTAEKIRAVCQAWYQESKEPFIVLIARNGIIILHESYGKIGHETCSTETTTEMASITKLLTGVMFAQFVDQGLIGIDDPVGLYLPDFPTSGDNVLTLRHCFTHTSGLWGHEEWGGLHDPWLDNKIAHLISKIEVGKRYEYNGMGYDLAGKVMEMVSGKSIFRLMRENLFDPLGMEKTVLDEDLGFGCHSNASDMAVVGQLLLNRGSYGNLRFFSPQTFEKFLPKALNTFYPDIAYEQGIGITWMRQAHPDAGKPGIPEDQTILSKNVIGHGSATSAILRVDLNNKLVISQTRRRGGKAYDKYLNKFLLAIDEGLSD